MSLEYLEQTNLAYRLVGALHILGRSRTGETRMACGPGNFEMSTNPMMRTADENRFQLGIDRDRSDPEVRGNDIGQRDQPVHGGVVLMVVGIAGLVISLVLASTARRTDVVHHTTSGDYVDPPRGDDPRL